ncbi:MULTISPECIES: DUF72 domain-containing protein [Acidithiobacillus]|nr:MULTISPECIES: DUF72 domain-containing protein [Acidithiobacillus]
MAHGPHTGYLQQDLGSGEEALVASMDFSRPPMMEEVGVGKPVSSPYHIGCSGWHYAHWVGAFYPPDLPSTRRLAFYAGRFHTVEINNSFYRLPGEKCLRAWHDGTPAGFLFALKASRFITHMKKLKDSEASLARLLGRAESLREKLGPVLFQLPPHWRRNAKRLERFLRVLPSGHCYAFEMRDPSWHHPEIYALLKAYNAAFCIFDIAGFQSPIQLTTDFAYIRLHGPSLSAYAGCYTTEALRAWAARIRTWDLRTVYVYFDNDQAAYATRNALELMGMLGL